MSDSTLRVHLARLLELGYLMEHKGRRGQTMVYELLYNGEGRDGERFTKWLADLAKLKKKYKL